LFVDVERSVFIGRLFNGVEESIEKLVENDPQYVAVKKLIENLGCSVSSLLVIGNSIVSYMLNIRGEDYWLAFSQYICSRERFQSILDLLNTHINFLKNTRYNVFNINAKIKRLHRFYKSILAKKLYKNPTIYCEDLSLLNRELALILKGKEYMKTIVFATKMYYYLCRICGVEVNVKGGLPIPVDRRNAFLSLTSCMIRDCRDTLRKCIEDLLSVNSGLVIEAWNIVCRESKIPCLVLDTFTWLVTGIYRDVREPGRVYGVLKEKYGFKRSMKLYELINELFRCMY